MNYSDAPTEPVRGGRSKLCVTDWNGDGLIDLLVGDVSYQKPKPKKLSVKTNSPSWAHSAY